MAASAKPEECESCAWETTELTRYGSPYGATDDEGYWFCAICAGTFAGNASQYPTQYPDAHILKTIAYCTNAIIATIRDANRIAAIRAGGMVDDAMEGRVEG